MEYSIATDVEKLARDHGIATEHVRQVAQLLDQGFSIPFLARYRRSLTGNLDAKKLVALRAAIRQARALDDRKQTILRSLASHHQLTPELEAAIRRAETVQALEDIYRPLKRWKRARSSSPAEHERLRALVAKFLDPHQAWDWESDLGTSPTGGEDVKEGAQIRREFREELARELLEQPAIRAEVRARLETRATIVSRQLPHSLDQESPAPELPSPEGAPHRTPDTPNPTSSPPHEPQATATSVPTPLVAPPQAPDTPIEQLPAEKTAENSALTNDQREPPMDGGDSISSSPPTSAVTAPTKSELRPPSPMLNSLTSLAEQRRQQRLAAKRKRRRRLELAFRHYFHFRKSLGEISPMELLDLDQGERLRILELCFEYRLDAVVDACAKLLTPSDHPRKDDIRREFRGGLRQECDQLVRDIVRELVQRAEARKLQGQEVKLKRLLLRRPWRTTVIAIEPQLRRDSTVVVLSSEGRHLEHVLLNFSGPESKKEEALAVLQRLMREHNARIIALGDGPESRELQPLLLRWQSRLPDEESFAVAVVRSAGTHLVARSSALRDYAQQPEHVRRAICLGRRFQNPLLEYLRLDMGRFARLLFGEESRSEAFDLFVQEVCRECLAQVGVDANHAESHLLRFIPGLNPLYAQRIEQRRKELVRFDRRESILNIESIDQCALAQAIPFLQLPESPQPLDRTLVHPEDYGLAEKILEACGISPEAFLAQVGGRFDHPHAEFRPLQALVQSPERDQNAPLPEVSSPGGGETVMSREAWRQRLRACDLESLSHHLSVDVVHARSVLEQLMEAGTEPWNQLPEPVLRRRIPWDQVQPGDQVVGTVTNLVPFGAFVELGSDLTGLLHVSRISDSYVADAKELLDEGDQLRMWVVELDRERKRVSLSLVPPPAKRGRDSSDKRRTPGQRSAEPVKQDSRRTSRQPPRKEQPRRQSSAPAKPVVPITQAMKEGREPMRTFSDLAQFFEHVRSSPPEKKNQDKEKGR